MALARRQSERAHRRAEETGLPDCPGKAHRADRSRLVAFGILKQADPALVDPGVTAQLECLLDDVVVGKQEMVPGQLL
jgi:hypothetical protein